MGDDTFTYKADNGDRESVAGDGQGQGQRGAGRPAADGIADPDAAAPAPLKAGACANDIAGTVVA